MTKYYYKAYGLIIESALELPEMVKADEKSKIDIKIKFGTVPEELCNAVEKGVCYQAGKDEFLLKVRNIGKYMVTGGNEIVIEPVSDELKEEIRLFLLGSALGAMLHQRGMLVLHGSSVCINGKGVVFVGNSGVGKSTTAAAFAKKGYKIMSDDITCINIIDGIPYIIPGFPNIKLWDDAARNFGEDVETLTRVRKELKKYRIGVQESYIDETIPISKVVTLSFINENGIKCSKIESLEKIEQLIKNTYRFKYLSAQGGKGEHFKQCAATASKIEMYKIERDKEKFSHDELIEIVKEGM